MKDRLNDMGELKASLLFTQNDRPDEYRLYKRKNGSLVLQGAFRWSCGKSVGAEWRDLPTVEEE